jgi:hypothetical protein
MAGGRAQCTDRLCDFGNLIVVEHGYCDLRACGKDASPLALVRATIDIGDPVGAMGGTRERG